MKPSLFDPAEPLLMQAASVDDIPTGEQSTEELIAELAIISRNHVATTQIINMKLAALTFPEEFRRIIVPACTELGALVKLHEDAVALMQERHGQLLIQQQQLADRLADMERRFRLLERQAEEPRELDQEEDRGVLNVRRGYKYQPRRTF